MGEELKFGTNAMSSGQEELRDEISTVQSSQSEWEEKVTETLHKQLKGVREVVRLD
jgi:gas vesicle protein